MCRTDRCACGVGVGRGTCSARLHRGTAAAATGAAGLGTLCCSRACENAAGSVHVLLLVKLPHCRGRDSYLSWPGAQLAWRRQTSSHSNRRQAGRQTSSSAAGGCCRLPFLLVLLLPMLLLVVTGQHRWQLSPALQSLVRQALRFIERSWSLYSGCCASRLLQSAVARLLGAAPHAWPPWLFWSKHPC
jgi:hypothetical protein